MKTISLELIDDVYDTQNYNSELENEGDIKFLNVLLNRLLNNREREIIRLYYGIGVEERMTLSELSERFDLQIERVRQTRLKAERKLRKKIPVDLFN